MKEFLIWAQHTRRWEFAHKETIPETELDGTTFDAENWVRRDGSHICFVGTEVAILPVPPAPVVPMWSEKKHRDGGATFKLSGTLKRGEHRPTVTLTSDGKVLGNGKSGFIRKFGDVQTAKHVIESERDPLTLEQVK